MSETLAQRAARAMLTPIKGDHHVDLDDGVNPLSILGWTMGTTDLSYEEALSQLVTKAVEIHDAERERVVVAATAQHWAVSHVTDTSGEWTFLEVVNPNAEEGAPPVVNVSLSDVEAAELADALVDRTFGN